MQGVRGGVPYPAKGIYVPCYWRNITLNPINNK